MLETPVDCSVRLWIAHLDTWILVALMGLRCLRIRWNDCTTSLRRCEVAVVIFTLSRGRISLGLAVRMLVLALITQAPLGAKPPVATYPVLLGALPLPIRVGMLALWMIFAGLHSSATDDTHSHEPDSDQ
jgi:hypothetical protein